MYRTLGGMYQRLGNLTKAESLLQTALDRRRALYGRDLINLGAVRYERGQYAEAERYYRDALAITEGWYGKEHYKTASNFTMLGRSLHMQQRRDEASEILTRAVAIQERVRKFQAELNES
jgi:serine/threonine-protein kinase